MAEFVFNDLAQKRRLPVQADSCATSTEEIGNDIHSGTRRMLRAHGVPFATRAARQLRRAEYDEYDHIIAMDSANVRNILRITGGDPDGKMRMLLPHDVADPWYTGNFDETYRDVSEGCTRLLEELKD